MPTTKTAYSIVTFTALDMTIKFIRTYQTHQLRKNILTFIDLFDLSNLKKTKVIFDKINSNRLRLKHP